MTPAKLIAHFNSCRCRPRCFLIKSASGATLQSRLANEPREPVVDPAKELEEYQDFMKFCTSMPNFHLDPLGRSGPRDPISETRAKELECGGGYVLNKEQ